jgi:predicted Rossmann fold flavoprotein
MKDDSSESAGKKSAPKDHGPLWDLVIIGGGPSGMMAAGRAAELGAHVLILEKNESLGKKLLITGGGRCNVTNSEFDTRALLAKFKDGGKFMFSPFSQYGVKETLDFFHINSMPTKVENEKRTFPISDTAASVLEVLKKYMASGHVVIQSNAEVAGLVLARGKADEKDVMTAVKLKNGELILAKKFVLATGGKSRPETGSTGDGFIWARKLGHTVIEPSVSLVPLKVKDTWIKDLAGITLPEVKITVLQNGARQNKPIKGKILFTHVGVSGPTILNLSKDIGELLKYGEVFISVDVLPNIDQAALDAKLNTLFRTEINKKLKNCLGMIGGEEVTLPTALIKTIIGISGVSGETPAHSVTKEDRRKILAILKGLTMQISGLLGTDKAIVTSGGVALTEIDPRTMQSRIHPNLYLVGDMLHIDRPSGGYSLQLCWTTGYVAGTDAGGNARNSLK